MAKNENSAIRTLYLVLIIIGVLILLRLILVFRWAIVSGLIVTSIGFGIWFLWKFIQKRRREKAYRESIEGIVEQRREYCEEQILENKKEISEIKQSIKELEEQLNKDFDIPQKTKTETEKLLHAFQKEEQVRNAKIEFYKAAVQKLTVILNHHNLTQKLAQKQASLKQLQERHYEDLADLEELKSNIEYDKMYLETIDALSNRLLATESVKDVEVLHLELQEMTKELNN